jgi:hypothetical protein
MGKQHHFVVYYDENTNQWNVDYDTQDIKFDNKPIYDPAEDEWLNVAGEIDDDNSIYNRAADALYEAITNLPLREKG